MSVLFLVIGLFAGTIITLVCTRIKYIGSLRIDRSDEEPCLFLELSKGVKSFENRKYVLLKIHKKDFISH